jgi:hypothetical protein
MEPTFIQKENIEEVAQAPSISQTKKLWINE